MFVALSQGIRASVLTLPSCFHGRRDVLWWNGLQTWSLRATLRMKLSSCFFILSGKSLQAPELSPRLRHWKDGDGEPGAGRIALGIDSSTKGFADILLGTTPLGAAGWHSFSRAAVTTHHNWATSNNRNVFPHPSGDQTSKIRVLTGNISFWRL